MSTLSQTLCIAQSGLTLHASLDISISLAFNIRIVWAARVISSVGIPGHLQIVKRCSQQREKNGRAHLGRYLPIRAS